jgi:putative GTP pyrophosphokinase
MSDRQRSLKPGHELSIRRDYEARRREFDALAEAIRLICESILRKNGVPFHSVKARVKSVPSVLGKIIRKKYEPALRQLTDLVGIRIICLYPLHVDKVVELLKKEFNVCESVDKRPAQDELEFGYNSVHLVCNLSKTARASLPEYSHLEAKGFEIQVRTILQEAWSEIEHELVYKSEAAAPKDIKRKIVRLSGSLEIADEQFQQIYDSREKYLAKLKEADTQGLEHEQLNVDSLLEVIRRRYNWAAGWEEYYSHGVAASLSELVSDMRRLGITTVRQLVHMTENWYQPEFEDSMTAYLIASGRMPNRTPEDAQYLPFEQMQRDVAWFHKHKHYFMPVAQIRGILYREFPDYEQKMSDGTWREPRE